MALQKHNRVFHRGLRKEGVVVAVLSSGLYQVAVGNLIAQCREEDLEPLPKGRGGGPRLTSTKSKAAVPSRRTKRPPAKLSVDLHGMRVEEALQLVESRINQALLQEIDAVEIVHGLGTGRLKSAVHQYLSTLSVVKHYKLDETNPGTTWVYF